MCLEQILLGVRYLLHIAINDKPEWVKVALARKAYESKQALKFEVSSSSISQKCSTIFFCRDLRKTRKFFSDSEPSSKIVFKHPVYVLKLLIQ